MARKLSPEDGGTILVAPYPSVQRVGLSVREPDGSVGAVLLTVAEVFALQVQLGEAARRVDE